MITPFQLKKHFDLLSTRRNKRTYVTKDNVEGYVNDKYRFVELLINVKTGVQTIFDDDEERYVIISPESEIKFVKVTRTEIE